MTGLYPTLGAAWNLKQVCTILQARQGQGTEQTKPVYIAEGTGSSEALLAALEWTDGIQLRANFPQNNPTYFDFEDQFEPILKECAKSNRLIEFSTFTNLTPPSVATSSLVATRATEAAATEAAAAVNLDLADYSPQKLVEPLLDLAYLARKFNLSNLLFSLEIPNSILQVATYRYLAAKFSALTWDYPIHLSFTGSKPTLAERLRVALTLGSLLEDGIGDSLHVSFEQDSTLTTTTTTSPHYQDIELALAYRIVRRYTHVSWKTLEKAGVDSLLEQVSLAGTPILSSTDPTPVVVASDRANNQAVHLNFPDDCPYSSEKKISTYPYVISNLPDYRHPYHYQRQASHEIVVGDIPIGGGRPLVTLGRLSSSQVKQLCRLEPELEPEEENPATSSRGSASNGVPGTEPDIYLVNNLNPQIKSLQAQGKLARPLVVGIQSVEQLEEAISLGAAGVSFCVDYVGQISKELADLEKVAQVLGTLGKPLPLFLVSTHNAGQSWGSYDYWPDFMEAYQMIEAIELCQKHGVNQLIVGIYTYNPAWNTQN